MVGPFSAALILPMKMHLITGIFFHFSVSLLAIPFRILAHH